MPKKSSSLPKRKSVVRRVSKKSVRVPKRKSSSLPKRKSSTPKRKSLIISLPSRKSSSLPKRKSMISQKSVRVSPSPKKIVIHFKINGEVKKVELDQTEKMTHIKDVRKAIFANRRAFGLVGDIKRDEIILKDIINKQKKLEDDDEINRNLVLLLQIDQFALPSSMFENISSFLDDHNKVSTYLGKKGKNPDLKHVEKIEKYLPIIERLEKYHKIFEKDNEYIKSLFKGDHEDEYYFNDDDDISLFSTMKSHIIKLGLLLLDHNFSKKREKRIEVLTRTIIDDIKRLRDGDDGWDEEDD